MLFDEAEMLASWRQIEAVDYHQEVVLGGGLRFTPYHAGHVLGACMFMIDMAGLRVLYTGDYSREEDRHLVQAEVPPMRPDVLICESTYGTQSLEPRLDKEMRFTSLIHSIIRRGGRVLLPVFVLGRAQELLLLLDEYWEAHPELHSVPIYYASSLARKCMSIYQNPYDEPAHSRAFPPARQSVRVQACEQPAQPGQVRRQGPLCDDGESWVYAERDIA